MSKLGNSLSRRPSVEDADGTKSRRRKSTTTGTKKPDRNSRRANRNSTREAAATEPTRTNRNRNSDKTNKNANGECTITMQRMKETKNKWLYHEVDDDTGKVVENPFRDGRIGQAYFTKELIGDKPNKEITITVNF
jgi:hypothetical protein